MDVMGCLVDWRGFTTLHPCPSLIPWDLVGSRFASGATPFWRITWLITEEPACGMRSRVKARGRAGVRVRVRVGVAVEDSVLCITNSVNH